ncbi:MAG: hypothetical protein U9R50_03580 [Campylobacterota bacterium]|nr:hypothetical protein [Campylobacterota bacterium]
MVNDKILFITKDESFLLFDGDSFSPIEAKKSKNYYSTTTIPAALLRTHGIRVSAGISDEKLEIQAEMSMYEEAGLDPDNEYVIASTAIDLANGVEKFIESYAIESTLLTQHYASSVSKLKQIDYIVPSFLRYEALYSYEKLEAKNDVFIYFNDDEAYAVMYKDGKYISTRTVITLSDLAEKLEIDILELRKILSAKGIDSERYAPEDLLKMHSIQEEFSKIAERIAHAISHKRGIFGLDSIDRFFIDFDGEGIPGFLEIFENYGFSGAEFIALNVFDTIEASQQSDALSALYLLGAVQERYKCANLSIFERRPAFYKTHAGQFFMLLGVSSVLALTYPLYASIYLSDLEHQEAELEKRVSAMQTLTKKLQKKLKEVRGERKRLEGVKLESMARLESYDDLVDTLKEQRREKHSRQKMMQDVNEAMSYYKLSSRNLDQNASGVMYMHIISEYEKRSDIAKFMKRLLSQGYLHVNTKEIRREENLYESIIEIRR